MSDCATRFEELTHETDVVLDEDLAALGRLPERTRIERYNDIKANEEEFVWEFSEDCPDFLTDEETDRVRGQFRLARLLLAASFYAEDGSVPRAMADDFIEAELQAVVDFDRYKQFDALTEDQIEGKIRRMEGEVYDLVTEYTSTQIANMDELIENPDVQQDLIERLVERYEDRREKIRHGFFVYVETHGLEHMVEAIEEAVTAVNDAAAEREAVREELQAELDDLTETLDERFDRQYRQVESRLQELEGELASQAVDPEAVAAELDRLAAERDEADAVAPADELSARIERTSELGQRIEVQIDDLEAVKETVREQAAEEVREETTALVEEELANLRDQRDELRAEVERLQREREQIETARQALADKQESLESRVAEVEQSFDGDAAGGIDGGDVVTATTARMLEMDYLGRFDISMSEAESIRTGDGTFEVPEDYWDGRSTRHNEWPRLVSLVEEDRPEGYPVNGAARYEVTASRYLGLTSDVEMVIEARVVADLEAYATNGFDASPADQDDFLAAVNDAVDAAETGEHDYLLALASPTGWSERVRDQIEAGDVARTRYSQYLSVCLVDLQDGTLVYDEADPVARENADLFSVPIRTERLEDCVETVRREYVEDVAHESVLLQDVVDEHGYDAPLVKRAFNRLEAEGAGEQLYLDELGLSFECGT